MVRPIKRGFDYYSHYTDTFLDSRIRKLIREFEGNGYLLYNYLLNEIFRKEGYYINYSVDLNVDIANHFFCLNESLIERIICFLLDQGLFSKEMYENNAILTSEYIQLLFEKMRAGLTRKSLYIESKYYLLSEDYTEYEKNIKNAENEDKHVNNSNKPKNNSNNVDKMGVSINKSATREGNEKKGKKIKRLNNGAKVYYKVFLEIFLMEKNYNLIELQNFIEYYNHKEWKTKEGEPFINLEVPARNWKAKAENVFLNPIIHEKWKQVWLQLKKKLGNEEASFFLSIFPFVQQYTIQLDYDHTIENDIQLHKTALEKTILNIFQSQTRISFRQTYSKKIAL